jgi:C4-dicarboxylate-specific signal transduction histidine kinase
MNHCHVLFVDDEPENLAVFEAACADRFPVLTAASAAKGLELMRSHEVGVLLADQRMPGMTGLELLEQVQAQFPQTVRMLVTAYSDLNTAIDAINRGRVRRYLRKPWDHDELHATLAEAIDLYQMASKVTSLERRLVETERVYSLGVIAAGLARELKNPVGAMNANIVRAREIVRSVATTTRTDAKGASVERAQLFDADEELAEALVGLGRILDVVRGIELPTREGAEETADLTEVLRLTMRLVQTELRSSASLELDVKPVPPVAGSTAKLGQVVLNLLVNALQAMAWEPRSKKMLSIRLVPEEGWVRFEVADSGPGIPPDLLPHVFDPFSPAGRDRGTGLGLAISKTIVEEIGGHIEAENRPTGGALFRIRLPAMGDTRIINVVGR